MAGYKDPPKEHQFKPGQSGFAGRTHKKRPDVAQLAKLIEESGALPAIAKVWLQMALGDKSKGIKPDLGWFKLMVEQRNGAPPRNDDDGKESDAVRQDVQSIRDLVTHIIAADTDQKPSTSVERGTGKQKRMRKPRRAD